MVFEGHVISAKEASESIAAVNSEWNSDLVDRSSVRSCEEFLNSVAYARLGQGNHYVMKLKSHLVMLYSLREEEHSADVATLQRRETLCREILAYLARIDPGQTRKVREEWSRYNIVQLNLNYFEFCPLFIFSCHFMQLYLRKDSQNILS